MSYYPIEQLFDTIMDRIHSDNEKEQFFQYLQQYVDNQKNEITKQTISKNIINDFMNNNMIYYNKTSKLYYHYINNHYVIVNEDNMSHHANEFISNFKTYRNQMNLSLKTSIKHKMIRSIRENSIYENIPDTETIQLIVQYLYPSMFKQKEYCKLFLLLIGNIVLKKKHQQKLNVFMRSEIKSFLSTINKYISMYFCSHNVFNYFKFKYTQDHINHESILIPSNAICYDMFQLNEQFYVNLICVSIYYANRYKTIDNYLDSLEQDANQVKDRLYFFRSDKRTMILEDYKNTYLIQKEGETMSQKDILFLWKKYIHEKELFAYPFTSHQDFIQKICNYVNENTINNQLSSNLSLQGYCSIDIPIINVFRDFWEKHFTFDEDEYYFETSEILYLLNKEYKPKKISISESIILLIIQTYYSHFSVVNNKIIHNLKSSLWDKKKDLNEFIEKNNIDVNDNSHNLYRRYATIQRPINISKSYFSMYIEQLRGYNSNGSP
jgi:hypothetical protein